MRTEAKRSFKHGFVLTEQELRRTFDCLVEQMKRGTPGAEPGCSYELKYRNGVIAEPVSLDEILAQENYGSAAIQRLRIEVEDKTSDAWSISVEFIDADCEDEPGDESVRYRVVGADRDWVFVTSSLVEERIAKVKRFAPNQLAGRRLRLIAPLIILMVGMTAMLFGLLFPMPRPTLLADRIDAIEAGWQEGRLADAVDVMLALERAKIDVQPVETRQETLPMVKVLVAVLIGGGLFTGSLLAWGYFFPIYNFLWGDYTRVFERRQSQGKFVIGSVVLVVVLTVVGNYISSKLGIR